MQRDRSKIQSAFTFCGRFWGSQDGLRFGPVLRPALKKNHHWLLAAALIPTRNYCIDRLKKKCTLEALWLETKLSRTEKLNPYQKHRFVGTPAVG